MKFIIIGKNIDVTPGLKDAVENKLGKLQRYFTPDTDSCNTQRSERTSED